MCGGILGYNQNRKGMKNFDFDTYLDILMLTTIAVLVFSVGYTMVTGISPMEAMGINPAQGTIGTVVVVAILIFLPKAFQN
jgi:hypothetical protein